MIKLKITEKIMLLKNRGITYEEYCTFNNEIEKDEANGFVYLKNVCRLYIEECKEEMLWILKTYC